MKATKKIVPILLALLVVLTSLSGCVGKLQIDNPKVTPPAITGSSEPGYIYPNSEDNPLVIVRKSTPPKGFTETNIPDTLTLAQAGEPNTLYSTESHTLAGVVAMRPLYDPLIRYNMFTHQFEPALAESWEMIDEKTIRLHIRKGVKCHAGYEMTADDVYWTVKVGQESPIAAKVWKVFDLENTKVIDKYTIDIATPQPFGPILTYLSNNEVGYPTNQRAYEESSPDDYGRHPVGCTGPYKIVDWIAGDRIIYERNEDYWGPKPYFKKLIIRNINDNVTRTASLASGEVDVVLGIDNSNYASLLENPMVNLVEFPSYWLIKMCLNNKVAPFNDVRVRHAIRYGLDIKNIVNVAYNGLSEVGDACWPNAMSVYEPAPEELSYTYNPEKAKALLKDAGYDENNPLTFELWVANVMEWMQMAEMIHNQLANIGVNVIITPMDQMMMMTKLFDGTFQAEISRFSCAADEPDVWWTRLRSDIGYEGNTCQYKNDEVDKLLEEARFSLNEEYRTECYKKIQNLFREDLPWISLACPTLIHGIRSTLDGLEPHPYGVSDASYIHPIG